MRIVIFKIFVYFLFISITMQVRATNGELEQSLKTLSQHLDNLSTGLAKSEQKTTVTQKPAESIDMQAALKRFEELASKSEKFNASIAQFPTQTNRIKNIAINDSIKAEVARQADAVRPIMDKKVEKLITDFITFKKNHGSTVEKKFYANMKKSQFIDRLLIKRPIAFYNKVDTYLLRDKKNGQGGFEAIGKDTESEPLKLENYLSYDEMQISALLGVSVPTYFINNGNRGNSAKPSQEGTYQKQGIYVGLVGTRFEKPGFMEWQHMIVTSEQNTEANGYGKHGTNGLLDLWATFYGIDHFASFEQAKKDTTGRFVTVPQNAYLDTQVFKERMRLVIEPYLSDAENRGLKENKKVYCHVVGLGMGYWAINQDVQAKYLLKVYNEILSKRKFSQIADIDFSWFPGSGTVGGIGDGGTFTKNGNSIKIHFSRRNPADKLIEKDADKLLHAQYAWDGNAYPGNEYWFGLLDASGDPAAASCSTIPELQNPLINSEVSEKNLLTV